MGIKTWQERVIDLEDAVKELGQVLLRHEYEFLKKGRPGRPKGSKGKKRLKSSGGKKL
jgi:hypothetical protein